MASELLRPYGARLMQCYPVSTRINHVANDDEECSAPVELATTQNRIFSCGAARLCPAGLGVDSDDAKGYERIGRAPIGPYGGNLGFRDDL